MEIEVPQLTWVLGEPEDGLRPLYYYPTPEKDKAEDAKWPVRVGSIKRDYAERVMAALNGGLAR